MGRQPHRTPRWTPDGQSIVFYSTRSGRYQFWQDATKVPERLVATSRGRLVLVDTRLKESRELYEQPGRRISYVAVSPDGRRLYFTSGKTDADVWLMRFPRREP